jgi:hypothetical protein
VQGLLSKILHDYREGPGSGDFSCAEQAAMAAAVLFTAMTERGVAKPTPAFKTALNALYTAVQDRDRFDAAAFQRALAQVESALAKTKTR